MHRLPTSRWFAVTLVLQAAILTLPSAHAQDNQCNAAVKFVRTEPDGSGTKFVFAVTTACETSAGSFEYSFTERGRHQTRNSPAWAASEGKDFPWTDTYNAPPAEISNVKIGKVTSTIVSKRK